MSERTEVSFDAALMMALRADAQKELDELPTPAQLKERYPDTSRWDARLKAALHKRRPVLKRVLVAAMTLVILTLGALAVSADFRKAVYTMIQKFLPIEMQLTYQVDGEPLEQLPNGYSDYYVPDGFERDREQEFERAENFLHVYSSKESGKGYTVRCSIIPVSYTHLPAHGSGFLSHNISQPELAKEIGCSKSTISRFISGAKGTLTHEPVSYTHLDVYKRQIKNQLLLYHCSDKK